MSDNVFAQRAAGLRSSQTLAATAAATAAVNMFGSAPWTTAAYLGLQASPIQLNTSAAWVSFTAVVLGWLVPVVLAWLALRGRTNSTPAWVGTAAASVVLVALLHIGFVAINAVVTEGWQLSGGI